MRAASKLKPRGASLRDLQRKHIAPLSRVVPGRDGSVYRVPLEWLSAGDAREQYARFLLAEPHVEGDPYSELGGEA